MLVLSRQRDETIMIGDDIEITIVDIRGDKVRLGITAPATIPVHRKEVYEAIQRENREAAKVKMDDLTNQPTPPSAGPGHKVPQVQRRQVPFTRPPGNVPAVAPPAAEKPGNSGGQGENPPATMSAQWDVQKPKGLSSDFPQTPRKDDFISHTGSSSGRWTSSQAKHTPS